MSGRLGIYFDAPYWVTEGEGARISSAHPLVLFFCELGKRFDALVLFGHAQKTDSPSHYALPEGVGFVELPYYENLRRLGQVLSAVPGTAIAGWRGLARVDTLWIIGPHPFALILVGLALLRRKRIVLGVRQDTVAVARARVRGRWNPALVVFYVMEWMYRALRLPTIVQGLDLARRFGGKGRRVLAVTESVVRRTDVAAGAPERDWAGEIELLTVGRMDPEKNPLLLVATMARLEQDHPGRYRLTWVGQGPLEAAVRERAAASGLEDRIDFRGYVPIDGGLLDLYRRAHVFVHVSFSEGMPKVLIEALVSATPIVATDVGGVRAALDDGRAGVLVPAGDLDALVDAVRRIVGEQELRDAIVDRGLELAQTLTVEAQADRVAEFIAPRSSRSRPSGSRD